ncbi:MAG: Na+/H+ antiporter NhaA [Anaerolineales bacterium]
MTIVILLLMNRIGVSGVGPYLIAGAFLWVFVLKSGVHATLAGVATAFAIPIIAGKDGTRSPLRSLEHMLHPWVAFGIMPIFAFANAGPSLGALRSDALLQAVPMGIFFGLILGKPVGVTVFSWIAIRLGIARLPEGASWSQLIGIGMLCGIGFTMSLFIASLAFEHGATAYLIADRIGILAGSLVAGLFGFTVLRRASAWTIST